MKRMVIIIFILVILIITEGCSNKRNNRINENTTKVNFQDDNNFIEVFGIVKSIKEKSINFTFSAQITSIPVKDGERVKEGDVLLTLSLSDMEIKIKNKEYELLNEEFELKKLSLDNYDINSHKYLIQKKKVENLQFELKQLKDTLINNKIVNGQLRCDVKNGVVNDIAYAEGDFIQDDKKIMTIYDLDNLKIKADIPEEFIKDVKVGQKVKINPVADRSKEYTGTVDRIYEVAEQKGGETIVYCEISIDNKDDFLLPNYNVDVKITADLDKLKKESQNTNSGGRRGQPR